MIRTPPAGKALIGLAGIGIDWRMLIVAPALQGGYFITIGSSDPDAGVVRWAGPDMPIEPQDIATAVSSISDADWASPTVEWHAIECAPTETSWIAPHPPDRSTGRRS